LVYDIATLYIYFVFGYIDRAALNSDRRGMWLRFLARLPGDALRAVCANAISMPVPQIPEALAQEVIDGCVLVWEAVPTPKTPTVDQSRQLMLARSGTMKRRWL
jgi:hypothetical protein